MTYQIEAFICGRLGEGIEKSSVKSRWGPITRVLLGRQPTKKFAKIRAENFKKEAGGKGVKVLYVRQKEVS